VRGPGWEDECGPPVTPSARGITSPATTTALRSTWRTEPGPTRPSESEPIDTSATASPDARSHSRASDLVRAFYEPFRTGDTSVYREILADDWVDLPLGPGQEQGPSGLPAQVEAFRRAFPDYDVTNEDLVVGGDRVAVDRIVATWHREDFAGLIAQLSAPDEAAVQLGPWT
jgi:predicted ester cyclase